MTQLGVFPFGKLVEKVSQKDLSPKKVFILGVYASAVHAKWEKPDGSTVVNALAVASEPSIFWTGSDVASIIAGINIPSAVGTLKPARQEFNGPSGRALDNSILIPLSLSRDDTWLCDLIPYSCRNTSQDAAIKREYEKAAQQHKLPMATTKPLPLIDSLRLNEITQELLQSKAVVLILLGDQPIKNFLHHFDSKWKKLADFGDKQSTYGNLHPVNINGINIKVLPLAHPRQIEKLGKSTAKWFNLHNYWKNNTAKHLL